MIYFIQDADGFVKIGRTERPRQRLGGLQTSAAKILTVLRIIDGDRPTERWLHRKFGHLRFRGEWFKFDPTMLTIVPPDEIPPRPVRIERYKTTRAWLLAMEKLRQEAGIK